MIREARRGHRIVRLKCGDPFVFGRGGEEALALAAAGVPCEIVPGISSATAAPLLSGIPITHRGLASAFVVVSGHAESAYGPVLRSLEPGSATIVVLMGLANRVAIAKALGDAGWRRERPPPCDRAVSRPGADAWHGTLDGCRLSTSSTLKRRPSGASSWWAPWQRLRHYSAQEAGGQDAVDPLRTSAPRDKPWQS